MNREQIEAHATGVANTKDGLSAKKLLDEITPCDREAVLIEAVRIANERMQKDPFSNGRYAIQVTEQGDQRVSTLNAVRPTFLGLGADHILPVLSITAPKECKN
mgnify:CR=1 FL=1